MRRKAELAGQRFGLLTARRMIGSGIDKATLWFCSCDCGGERIVSSGKLRNGSVTQCGCISKRKPKLQPKIVVVDKARTVLDYFLYQYPTSTLEIADEPA